MFLFDHFFLTGNLPDNIVTGEYIPWLVLLSYIIAVFGSYAAILLSDRMISDLPENFRKGIYHVAGAAALGAGIWTMHFIGMFAYHVNIQVSYDLSFTLLSLAFAIFFSFSAIGMIRRNMRPRDYVLGAILAGTAVTAMHYTGMAAMKMDAIIMFHPWLFLLSYAIAIAASGAALWMIATLVQYTQKYKQLLQFLAAAIMGIAVCGMHYTGMHASAIIPNKNCRFDTNLDNSLFISIVLFVGLCVIWGTIFVAIHAPKSKDKKKFERRASLRSQIILFLTFFLFMMIASIWFISNATSEKTISKWIESQRRSVAANILKRLERDTSRIEVLAFSLSHYASRADATNPGTIKREFPNLLNYSETSPFVAGGGIWPEPFAFDLKKERDSYFWGRDPKKGTLKFFNDYNDPASPGYHHEEWYVPPRYMPTGKCYWSGSYIDPYSREPMVTCSQGIYKNNNKFSGVVTIDMRLNYMRDILDNSSRQLNGYALLFDRDNRFIVAPKGYDVLKTDTEFMMSGDFALKNKWFEPIHNSLFAINETLRGNIVTKNDYLKIAKKIGAHAPSISEKTALNIAALLSDLHHRDNIGEADDKIEKIAETVLRIPNDQFLGTETDINIFIDQTNHWKLIVATPHQLVTNQTEKILFPVILTTVMMASLTLLAFYAAIQALLISPLNRIVYKLEDQQKNGQTDKNKLYDGVSNELGLIKYLFDQRSQDLQTVAEVATRSSHEKSSFLANMSHELRTPLNGILGMLQLIDPHRVPPDVAEIHALMEKSGNNLLEIVNDILDLSKIEANGVELESIPFDAHLKAHETVQLLLPMASKKGLSLLLISNRNPIYVIGDPLRFGRIVTNLISNAIRYTDNGSIKVYIETTDTPPNKKIVQVIIEDTGIGIAPEKYASIFEKFTQADNSTTRRFGGTGLGLAITKELVEMMGGEIGLTSTIGVGSKFWFNVPLGIANEEEVKASLDLVPKNFSKTTLSKNAKMTKQVRILVAEDHLMNQAFMKRLFQNMGIENYTIVDNGKKALEEVQTGRYDVILMDCHMPEMDGYDATMNIRNLGDPVLNKIPIIAMTANAMSGDEEKCLAIGMNAYISKPVSLTVFKQKLSPWIIFSP